MVNIWAIVAGALTLVAAGIHAVAGGREFELIRPVESDPKQEATWLQALCGWHWVTASLALAAALFLVIGLADVVPEDAALLALFLYFLCCGLAWLLTLMLARQHVENRFLYLGQWVLCFVLAGLAWVAR